jgi:hypothetical protein
VVFERYSDQARQAVELADVEARRLGHGHLGTEHLLLGIVAEGQSEAARALMAAGATLQGCRELVAEAVGEQPQVPPTDGLRLTERANRALERAARLARRRRDPLVETSHVLVSVLDVEGRAGQVLRGLGVDLVALRRAVEPGAAGAPSPDGAEAPAAAAVPTIAASSPGPSWPAPSWPAAAGGPAASPPAAPSLAVPVCARCQADLGTSLAYRIISAGAPGGDSKRFVIAYCAACGSAVGAQPE